MDEIDTPQTTSDSEATKSPNYSLRRASIAAGAILGVTAGVGIGNFAKDQVEAAEFKAIDSEILTVQYGDELTSVAEHAVENYFTTNNLDLTKIPYGNITEASITAAGRMNDHTGEDTTQPGEQFGLSIQQNEHGDYNVEIIPSLPATNSAEDETH